METYGYIEDRVNPLPGYPKVTKKNIDNVRRQGVG
jgi:hypothetical protein